MIILLRILAGAVVMIILLRILRCWVVPYKRNLAVVDLYDVVC